jgi:hypothetical protein
MRVAALSAAADRPRLEVDVGPAQPAQLAAPQTGQREVPQVCEPVLCEGVEELLDLDGGQRLPRHLADRQAVDERGDVVGDLALLTAARPPPTCRPIHELM